MTVQKRLFLSNILMLVIPAVLAKIGIEHINSTLATAIRTVVVLAFSWLMVFVVGSQNTIGQITGSTLLFLILSGLSTGLSWLCYYRALQDGLASVVVPIDRLSILVTIVFSSLVLKEKLSRKAKVGLALILAGTGAMLL